MTKSKKKRRFRFGKQEVSILKKLTAVILLWRGVWGLADLYILPNNPSLSFLISALVGLFVLWADDWTLNEFGYLNE